MSNELPTANARVTRTVTSTCALPFFPDVKPLQLCGDDDPDYEVLAALAEKQVYDDDEIVVLAGAVPPGCEMRKPFGGVVYVRIRSEAWLCRELGVDLAGRVLATDAHGGLQLFSGDAKVVVKLSDVASSTFLHELGDYRCPK